VDHLDAWTRQASSHLVSLDLARHSSPQAIITIFVRATSGEDIEMDFNFSSTTPAEGAQLGDFQILQALTEARNEHGMRQNEYDRYR
jgi:hypothetical protein